MTIHIGFSATKTANGEVVPDYATELTNKNTPVGKMIAATNELLKRHGVKGVNGVVGTYDSQLIGEAVHSIYNGAVSANTGYGLTITRQYFETAKLL